MPINSEEISNNDLYALMKVILQSNEEIKQELKLFTENTTKEIENLKTSNSELKNDLEIIKKRLVTEARKARKYNIVIYGVNETGDKLEEVNQVVTIIKNSLEVQCRYEDIRDCYRLGTKRNGYKRPILIELLNYNMKNNILERKTKLKGTRIFITKDYIPEDLEKRKNFYKNRVRNQNIPQNSDAVLLDSADPATFSKDNEVTGREDGNKKKNLKLSELRETKKYRTRTQL